MLLPAVEIEPVSGCKLHLLIHVEEDEALEAVDGRMTRDRMAGDVVSRAKHQLHGLEPIGLDERLCLRCRVSQ